MFKRYHYNSVVYSSLSFVATVAVILLAFSSSAHALSGTDFSPGYIISDDVFTDSSTMSTSEIQDFLEDLVDDSDQKPDGVHGSCDTSGTESYAGTTKAAYGTSRGHPPPYVCMYQYYENTTTHDNNLGGNPVPSGAKSAAQIIKDAAVAYDINPQVLIVLLQKEQSLITDDWPWSIQYRSATGYGCPDSGSCDSDYYGFYNQVAKAAWQFRQYILNPSSYNYDVGSNYILFNPNTSCGGSTVNIINSATAALYNYTPYQPNDAALANLYGSGDACSAYGNRNFWRYFNDWFGSTEGTPFFKVAGDNKTYILGSENDYYHVASYEMLTAYGFGRRFDYVAAKPSSYLSGRTFSGVLGPVARFETDEVYLIDRSGRYHFQTQAILEDDYGYTLGEEATLPAYLTYYYPDAGKMRTVIKEYGGDEIYVMENGKRRRVPDIDAFRQGSPPYSTLPYVRLSLDYMKSLTASYPLLGNNKLIMRYDTGSYGFWDGSLFYNIDRNTIAGLNLKPDYLMHSNEIANLSRTGASISVLVKSTTPSYYVLDRSLKRVIPNSQLASYGLTDADFAPAPDNFLSRINNSTMSRIVTVNRSGAKYLISGRSRDQFDSSRSIYEQGLNYSDILDISAHSGTGFPQSGKYVFATGTLFKISGQPQTYIINSSASKLYIDSNTIINEYNLDKSATRSLSSQVVSRYPTVGNLGFITKDSTNNVWLVHSGGSSQVLPASQTAPSRFNIDVGSTMKLSSYIYSLTTYKSSLKDILKDSSSGYLYYIESGQKRRLVSPGAIGSLGYDEGDISTVSQYFLQTIPSGADI